MLWILVGEEGQISFELNIFNITSSQQHALLDRWERFLGLAHWKWNPNFLLRSWWCLLSKILVPHCWIQSSRENSKPSQIFSCTKKSQRIESIHSTNCVARTDKIVLLLWPILSKHKLDQFYKHVQVFRAASNFQGYYLQLHVLFFFHLMTVCVQNMQNLVIIVMNGGKEISWSFGTFLFFRSDTKVGLFTSVRYKKQSYTCRSGSAWLLS